MGEGGERKRKEQEEVGNETIKKCSQKHAREAKKDEPFFFSL